MKSISVHSTRVENFCDKIGNEPEEAQVGQCVPHPTTLPSVREEGWVIFTVMMRVQQRPSPYTGQTHTCVAGVQGGDTEAQGC